MSEQRSRAAVRQLLLRLHFYAGVLIAPFLVVAALTGLLYAASYEVEDALYDELRTVDDVGGERLPLSEQVRAASEARPDWTVTGVRPAFEDEDAAQVLFDDGAVRESGAVAVVYVDPYTGAVQGDATSYGSSHAGPFREWVATFHRTLHLGEVGRSYSELAASWLWVIVLAGAVLWLTRRRRPGALLWPRRGAAGRARSLSWHAPVGLWLAVVLLFLSATGLTWSRFAGEHITELRAQLDWSTPALTVGAGEHEAHEGHGHDHGAPVASAVDSVDAVYEAARAAGLEGPLQLTLPAGAGGEFAVAETQRSFPVRQDAIAVALDESGGAEVTETLPFADWPFMAQAANVFIAAHMGLLFGLVNQLLLAAAMLAFLSVIFLGYRMWWQRRGKDAALGRPYPRGALRRLPWWLVALAVPVIAVIGWFMPLFGVPLLVFLVVDVLIGQWRRRRPSGDDAPPGEGVTRRTALGAASATAAIAGGVGYVVGSDHEHEGEAHDHAAGAESFYGERQGGIATPMQAHAVFAAFDLADGASAAGLRGLMEDWSDTAAALTRGEAPPKAGSDTAEHFDAEAVAAGLDPARLTVTFGFGPALFGKTGLGSAQPAKLVELPEFDGDQLVAAWSGGDLLVQICADDQQVAANAFLELRKRAAGVGTLTWVQQGFSSAPADGGTPRNLLGFKDGSLNPQLGSADFDARVWARDSEPDWFEGGTYLVFRKIRMKLPNWSMATAEEQHLSIGRDRDTGAPLSGGGEFDHPDFEALDASGLPAVPADSHVAVTHNAPMFRRGYNYDYGFLTQGDVTSDAAGHEHAPGTADHGHEERPYDAGLLFASFQADPSAFIETQEQMAASDRLMEFIVAEGSAIFAVPPGASEGGFVGEGLFGR
ncbi:Dyp-type peroxidase [Glycomyces tarimensis]